MSTPDFGAYAVALAKYYGPHLRTGHLDHQAVHWGSAWGQQVRFEALIAPLAPLSGTLLDLGCGLAHLADHLEERGEAVAYLGLDLLPDMIARARERRPDLELALLEPDAALPPSDYIVASGIFATTPPELMAHIIERMWSAARRAISFNALRLGAAQLDEGERAYSPAELIGMVERLSPRWALRADHHPNDLSITVWRPH